MRVGAQRLANTKRGAWLPLRKREAKRAMVDGCRLRDGCVGQASRGVLPREAGGCRKGCAGGSERG